MKRLVPFLFWWCLLCRLSAGSGEICTVRLLNGDRLQGRYLGQEGSFALIKTEMEEAPLRIHGRYIEALDFGVKAGESFPEVKIYFSPEQYLRGRILKYEEGRMHVKTAWVESLILEKDFIYKIKRAHRGDQVIFRGPGSLEKWKYSLFHGNGSYDQQVVGEEKFLTNRSGEWVCEGEGNLSTTLPLVNQGVGIQLGFDLPEIAAGDSLKLRLSGLPEMQNSEGGRSGLLEIVINHEKLTIEEIPVIQGRRVMFGIHKNIRGTMDCPPPGRFDLLVEYDPGNSRCRVKNQEQVIAEWELSGAPAERNVYAPQLSFEWGFYSGSFVIREVLAYLRENPLPQETVAVPEGDESILFQNGDSLKVDWQGVDENGDWVLALQDLNTRTSMAPERIQLWLNRGSAFKTIRRVPRHVQVKLAGGEESFIAELEKADGGAFTLEREGWGGAVRIPFSMVEELKFNPYF